MTLEINGPLSVTAQKLSVELLSSALPLPQCWHNKMPTKVKSKSDLSVSGTE